MVEHLPKSRAVGHRFGGGGRHARTPRELSQCLGVVHPDRILVPQWADRFECLGDPNRARQVPARVELDRDLHLHADRFANLAERPQCKFDLLGGDVLAVGGVGELVEGPDLHRRDAHRQQLLG